MAVRGIFSAPWDTIVVSIGHPMIGGFGHGSPRFAEYTVAGTPLRTVETRGIITDMVAAPDGTAYFAMTAVRLSSFTPPTPGFIGRISSDGAVELLQLPPSVTDPVAIALDDRGYLWVLVGGFNPPAIVRIHSADFLRAADRTAGR
jgi:hypothetical protein